jgi:hypothetical protein
VGVERWWFDGGADEVVDGRKWHAIDVAQHGGSQKTRPNAQRDEIDLLALRKKFKVRCVYLE